MPRPKKPLAFQLATASWGAPLIFILLNVIFKAGEKVSTGELAAGVYLLLALFLMLVGLLSGIAALFGLKRHGRKGILIPSLIGILISSLMLAVLVSNFVVAFRQAWGQ